MLNKKYTFKQLFSEGGDMQSKNIDIERLAKTILDRNHLNTDERSVKAMKEMYEQSTIIKSKELIEWLNKEIEKADEEDDPNSESFGIYVNALISTRDKIQSLNLEQEK